MSIFIFIGAVFLVFSILFYSRPNVIIKMNKFANKMVFADYQSLAYRKITAVVLFLVSLLMFYVGMML